MEPTNNHKKKLFYFFAAAGLLGAGLLGAYLAHNLSRVTTDDAYIEGRVHTIASKISGTVKEVRVIDNQQMQKGDLLVEIDPVDYALQVTEAQANLDVQQASFSQALRDLRRAQNLFKKEVFSKEQYEKAVTTYNLVRAKSQSAQEQLKICRQNLEYTKIYAPSNGFVTHKNVEAGNHLQPGQPIMALVALDDIWLVANYKETQLGKVKRGQRVLIKVDTYPGRTFTGRVDSITAGTGAAFSLFPPENSLGNYVKVVQRIPVKIVFDKTEEKQHVLRVGMSCVPTIITQDE